MQYHDFRWQLSREQGRRFCNKSLKGYIIRARVEATLHELLSRIHWDTEFGRGEFTVGYFGRVQQQLVYEPLREVPVNLKVVPA